MRALVFGAGGFVGRHLVEHLLSHGDEVFTTGLRGESHLDAAKSFAVDITDRKAVRDVFQRVAPDVVYHLAGISFVPEAENDFDNALRVNVGGTANIAHQAHLMGSSVSVLYVSSAEVYGAVGSGELPITEANAIRPVNNYSLSKYMGELVVERYARVGAVRSSIARPFNHIGPGQNERFVTANFALQLARIAHGLAASCLQVGNLEARRDFCDVRDIVRAYRLMACKGSGVYNLGSGRSYSVQEILETLIKVSGLAVNIQPDPERMRGPEVFELYASYDRIKAECGWEPTISLERSLEDIYRFWYDKVGQGVS